MRHGTVFKRCCRCGEAVRGNACKRCGRRALSWTFVVDAAPAGLPRRQKRRGGYATKREASAALARLLAADQLGIPWEGEELTTGQYLNDWLAEVARGGSIRPTTAKAYEVAIRIHIVPALGKVPIRMLSRGLIKDAYSALRGGRALGRRATLSPKGVHNVHLTLHRALQDAVADRLIPANPASRAHRMSHSRPTVRFWSPGELKRFLMAVADDPDSAMWRVSASTGMRRGELLGLRWRDFDLEEGMVCIQRQLIRNGRVMEFCHPKTPAGRRTICLDPATVRALVAHRDRQAAAAAAVSDPTGQDLDLAFCRKNGQPKDPDAVSHRFAQLVTRLGLPRIRLHDLRHTHATIALQAAINPKVVQERLGHASVNVTLDTYTHVLPPMHREAASLIAALVDAGS